MFSTTNELPSGSTNGKGEFGSSTTSKRVDATANSSLKMPLTGSKPVSTSATRRSLVTVRFCTWHSVQPTSFISCRPALVRAVST